MKILPTYTCERCGEIVHMEDVIKHLVSDHDEDWRGSFEDALDEYTRSIRFIRPKESESEGED